MKPYQQRVVDELNQLQVKRDNLAIFLTDRDVFPTLPVAEQRRLEQQAEVMSQYASILKERIADFS